MLNFRSAALNANWGLTLLVAVCAVFAFGPAPAAQGQNFFQDLVKAIDTDDFTTLRKMVKSNPAGARWASQQIEIQAAKAASTDDGESLAKLLNYLNQIGLTFKLEHKDAELETRYKWFKKLSPDQMKVRLTYVESFETAFTLVDGLDKSDNPDDDRRAAIAKYQEASEQAGQIEDNYYVGACYRAMGNLYDKLADFFAAAYHWRKQLKIGKEHGFERYVADGERSLEFYDTHEKVKRMDLINLDLPLTESRAAHAKALEESLIVKAPEGSSGSSAATNLTPPTIPAEYVWEDSTDFKSTTVKKVTYPWYHDGMRQNNPQNFPFFLRVGLRKGGEATAFPPVPGSTIQWAGKISVDPDGDGKQRARPVRIKIGKFSSNKWSLDHADGSQSDQRLEMMQLSGGFKIMGAKFEFAGNSAQVYFRGQAGIKGTIRGHEVTLVDVNMNGRFNDIGADCVVIGTGKNALVQPYSRYTFFPHEDGYYPYEIKVNRQGGSMIRSRPYDGDLAPLMVKWEGKGKHEPAFLTAKGDGENSDFFINLMMAREKMMWVPTTKLTIHKGAIFVGSGKKRASICIGRGTSRPFPVQGGKFNVWELGGAGERGFRLAAKMEKIGRSVKVTGASVTVFGNSGEEYFNFKTGVLLPKLELRKGEDGSGKRHKKATMEKVLQDDANETNVFFPVDLTLERVASGPIVGQLTLKHKILGDLKSEWQKIE